MEKKRRLWGIVVLFLVGAALLGVGIAGVWWYVLPSRSVGIIGGADGPTAIFVTGPGMDEFPAERIFRLFTWGPVVLMAAGAACCGAAVVLLVKGRKK